LGIWAFRYTGFSVVGLLGIGAFGYTGFSVVTPKRTQYQSAPRRHNVFGYPKTKMHHNVKVQHKWGHNKKTRLRDFSGYKSCVIKSSVKIKRGCVIFLVTKVPSKQDQINVPRQIFSQVSKQSLELLNR
jgi:hypothetical protein